MHFHRLSAKPQLWLCLILLVALLLFYRSFSIAFFQDDYLLLYISQADSLSELISFFSPIAGFPYRPLATHHTFYLLQSIFGLNPFWYHAVIFLQFLINGVLVFLILRHLLNSTKTALLSTFFYATSAAHYMSLYWIATFYFLQGTTFFLLAFWLYLQFRKRSLSYLLIGSILGFIVGILHNETVLVLPVVIGLYELLFHHQKRPHKQNYTLIPFFLITLVAVIFRMSSAGLPASSDYQLVFSPVVFFKSFTWYVLRALSLPEGIDFVPNKNVMLLLFTSVLGLLLTQVPTLRFTVRKHIKMLLFSLGWFVLTTMPFLIMPNHMSSYYLEISLVGVVLVIGVVLSSLVNNLDAPVSKVIVGGVVISWLLLSYLSVIAMEQTHWVNRRGELGESLRTQVEAQCDENTATVITDNIQEAEVTLSLDRGAKVLCHNPLIETEYQLK